MSSYNDEYLEIDESTYQFQPRSMGGKSIQAIAFPAEHFGVRIAIVCGNFLESPPITSDEFFGWLCDCYKSNPKPKQAEVRLSGNPQKDREFYFDIQSIYDKADGLLLSCAYQKIVELVQKAAQINDSFDEAAFTRTNERIRRHRALEENWIEDLPPDDAEKEAEIQKPGYAIQLFKQRFVDRESGDFAPLYKGIECQTTGSTTKPLSGINAILFLPKWYYYAFRNQSQGHHIPAFIRFVFLLESAEERLKQENDRLRAENAELRAENLGLKRLLREAHSTLVNLQNENIKVLQKIESALTANQEIQRLDSASSADKTSDKDPLWDKHLPGKESETEHSDAPMNEAISKEEKSQADTQKMEPNMKSLQSKSMPQRDLEEEDFQMH